MDEETRELLTAGWTRALLIVCTPLYSLGLLFDCGMATLSAMLFDAPGSEARPEPWAMFAAILLYPPLMLVGLWEGWRAQRAGQYDRAVRFALLPLTVPLLLALVLTICALV